MKLEKLKDRFKLFDDNGNPFDFELYTSIPNDKDLQGHKSIMIRYTNSVGESATLITEHFIFLDLDDEAFIIENLSKVVDLHPILKPVSRYLKLSNLLNK